MRLPCIRNAVLSCAFACIAVSTKKKSKTSIGLIIGVAVAGIAAFLIIALIAFYAIRQKKRADKAEVSRPFGEFPGFRFCALKAR